MYVILCHLRMPRRCQVHRAEAHNQNVTLVAPTVASHANAAGAYCRTLSSWGSAFSSSSTRGGEPSQQFSRCAAVLVDFSLRLRGIPPLTC